MKYLLILMLFFPVFLGAQNIAVLSFQALPEDMEARILNPKPDQNGDLCAIIKVVTTEQGFTFEGDMNGISGTERKIGEYWVYVPHGSKSITLRHPQLGLLRKYEYTIPIKEASVYEMVLTTGTVRTTVEDYVIPTEWVVINSEPEGANIFINEESKGVTPYQQELAEGAYTYRIEYPLYYPLAGRFQVSKSSGKVELNESLDPNFGSISIQSLPENGASVLLDGVSTGMITPCRLERITSAKHTISLQLEWYEPIRKEVIVEDNKVADLRIQMKPTFSNVVVTAENDAEIYIDGVRKSSSSWEGRLLSGFHTFEARKQNYYPDQTKIEIPAGVEKTISLQVKPKQGELKAVTTPYGATINLNGRDYGTTPITISELLVGTYRLKLSKMGYVTDERNIVIKENETTDVNTVLGKGMEVQITSKPTGAKVYIDGQEKGKTPFVVPLDVGTYRLRFEKENCYALEELVSVTQNSKKIFKELTGMPVDVSISSNPRGASVIVDGVNRGKTNTKFTIQASEYLLKIQHDGFSSIEQKVDLAEKREFQYNLKPLYYRSKSKALLYSALWPGSGQSFLNRGGYSSLMGVPAYGLVAASLITYMGANSAYEDYLTSDNVTLREHYLELAGARSQQSRYLLYGAVGTWAVNMIWTIMIPSDQQRTKNASPIIGMDPSGITTIGLAVNFNSK